MNVLGIDFTSAPGLKPLACIRCTFDGELLRAGEVERWSAYSRFENQLNAPGEWIAGIDFPFGQSRKFIEKIGWPTDWLAYVRHARSLGREGFRDALDSFRKRQPYGEKEYRRKTDVAACSISPQKIYFVPVGLMFFEGAPRLADSGVTIPYLHGGDPSRMVVEAYPGVLARRVIVRRPYKHDSKDKQTQERFDARCAILTRLLQGAARKLYGFEVEAPPNVCDDPAGDELDALLCAIQAAWAWKNRENRFGAPSNADPQEGWIADPYVTGHCEQAATWQERLTRDDASAGPLDEPGADE